MPSRDRGWSSEAGLVGGARRGSGAPGPPLASRLRKLDRGVSHSPERRAGPGEESGNRGAHDTFFKRSRYPEPSRMRKEASGLAGVETLSHRHLSVVLEARTPTPLYRGRAPDSRGDEASVPPALSSRLSPWQAGVRRTRPGKARSARASGVRPTRDGLRAERRPAAPPGRPGPT